MSNKEVIENKPNKLGFLTYKRWLWLAVVLTFILVIVYLFVPKNEQVIYGTLIGKVTKLTKTGNKIYWAIMLDSEKVVRLRPNIPVKFQEGLRFKIFEFTSDHGLKTYQLIEVVED